MFWFQKGEGKKILTMHIIIATFFFADKPIDLITSSCKMNYNNFDKELKSLHYYHRYNKQPGNQTTTKLIHCS